MKLMFFVFLATVFEAIQLMVSEASAQAEAAALIGEQTIDRNIKIVESGAPLTAEHVAWSRRNAAYSTLLARGHQWWLFGERGVTRIESSR